MKFTMRRSGDMRTNIKISFTLGFDELELAAQHLVLDKEKVTRASLVAKAKQLMRENGYSGLTSALPYPEAEDRCDSDKGAENISHEENCRYLVLKFFPELKKGRV
jgi:hypothetical protein